MCNEISYCLMLRSLPLRPGRNLPQVRCSFVLCLRRGQLVPCVGSAAAATDHSVLNLQSVQLTNEGLLEALSRDNMTFKQMLLDYNALTSLPLSICKMRTLTELYINNNQLQELPNEIGQLVGLKLLHVENNELSSLPSSISEVQIDQFHLCPYTRSASFQLTRFSILVCRVN